VHVFQRPVEGEPAGLGLGAGHGIELGNQYRSAFSRIAACNAASDTTARSGDQRHLVFQQAH